MQGKLLYLIRQNLWEENYFHKTDSALPTFHKPCAVALTPLQSMIAQVLSASPRGFKEHCHGVNNLANFKAKGELQKRLTTPLTWSLENLYALTLLTLLTLQSNVDNVRSELFSQQQRGTGSAVDKLNKLKLYLRVPHMHFLVSLPIKTITNLQGRYTSRNLKLPKNEIFVTNYVYKKENLSLIIEAPYSSPLPVSRKSQRRSQTPEEFGLLELVT